jgi:hypothetical protein
MLLANAAAHAQSGTHGDPALAETLFRDAKALMGKGDYGAACPKLAESQRLDPGTGTLMALAYCHEHEGKVASAWAEYTGVLAAARQAAQAERVKVATERIASIEPRLARMVVRVATHPSSRQGLEVRRDGIVLGEAAWGTSMPVDPGEHVVEARAPGYKAWSVTERASAGTTIEVVVPELQPDPAAPTGAGSATDGETDTRAGGAEGKAAATGDSGAAPAASAGAGVPVGWIVTAAGVAMLGVGTYFGVRTFEKRDDANALCPVGAPCTNRDAISANNDAHTSAFVSTLTVGVGIAAVGAGVYLLLAAKPAAASGAGTRSAQVSPLVGWHALGLSYGTAW